MYIYIFIFLLFSKYVSLSFIVQTVKIINQQYAYATCKTKVHKK